MWLLVMCRDPPFRPGNGGVRLSWESVPPAASIFRHLYDNGTINFVSLRWGNHANEVTWGTRNAKRKVTYWSNRPTDVQVGKWLPIFLEGIREYEVRTGSKAHLAARGWFASCAAVSCVLLQAEPRLAAGPASPSEGSALMGAIWGWFMPRCAVFSACDIG
eukprot:359264-Chlamydomonas_euryale.AAC.11